MRCGETSALSESSTQGFGRPSTPPGRFFCWLSGWQRATLIRFWAKAPLPRNFLSLLCTSSTFVVSSFLHQSSVFSSRIAFHHLSGSLTLCYCIISYYLAESIGSLLERPFSVKLSAVKQISGWPECGSVGDGLWWLVSQGELGPSYNSDWGERP